MTACIDVYGTGEVEIKDSYIQNSPSKGIMIRGQAKVTAEILHEVPELIIEDVEEPLEPGDPI